NNSHATEVFLKKERHQQEAFHCPHVSWSSHNSEMKTWFVFYFGGSQEWIPFQKSIPIGQSLGRMFSGTVSGIDQRNAQVLLNPFNGIGFLVTHDHQIAVSVEHFS